MSQTKKGIDRNYYNELTNDIIGAAIEVHKVLGPGLLESVYHACLVKELKDRNIYVEQNINLPIHYKGERLNKEFVIDLIVEEEVVIELKSLESVLPVHEAQLLSYIRLANKKIGLLINFNVQILKEGIKRKVNGDLNSV